MDAIGSVTEGQSQLDVGPDASLDLDLSIVLALSRRKGLTSTQDEESFNISQRSSDEMNSEFLSIQNSRRAAFEVSEVEGVTDPNQSMATTALGTSTFFGNDTTRGTRGRIKKSIEWESRLHALYEVFRCLEDDKLEMSELSSVIQKGFVELSRALKSVSSSQRPSNVLELLAVYAVDIIKLQQFAAMKGIQDCEEHLCAQFQDIMAYWLNMKNHLNEYDRAWIHTRSVVSLMFRNLDCFKTLMKLKHIIASMQADLLKYTAGEEDHRYVIYACQQLEHFSSLLTQQLETSERENLGN